MLQQMTKKFNFCHCINLFSIKTIENSKKQLDCIVIYSLKVSFRIGIFCILLKIIMVKEYNNSS